MGIVAVICALIGMQSFGGVYNEEAGFHLRHAQAVSARMMTSRSSRTTILTISSPRSAPYSSLLVNGRCDEPRQQPWTNRMRILYRGCDVGKFLIVNLFIGILLNAFSDDARNVTSSAKPGRSLADRRWAQPVGKPKERRRSRQSEWRAWEVVEEAGPHGPSWPADYSLLCFSPANPLRIACTALVESTTFERFIILMIIASCVCLGLDFTPSSRVDPSERLTYP